jgi:hypothetical protein
MSNTIYIACGAHGVSGASVEYSHLKLQRDIKAAKKMWTKQQAQHLHKILSTTLTTMLPEIMTNGWAVDSYGERYTRETFDQDLVCLAVYDHIGNNKQIGLIMPRGISKTTVQ